VNPARLRFAQPPPFAGMFLLKLDIQHTYYLNASGKSQVILCGKNKVDLVDLVDLVDKVDEVKRSRTHDRAVGKLRTSGLTRHTAFSHGGRFSGLLAEI
jgi:hypothetical protein